jgi:RNA polymerase sigma factor for flagellar operon FliA
MATLVPQSAWENAAREQLIMRHLPLVRHAVGSLTYSRTANLDAEDVLGYGAMGLIDAVDRFDPCRGVKFETYAVTRIRGYLVDQLRALDWLSRTARSQVREVQRAAEEIESSVGRRPTPDELATRTGLPVAVCNNALAAVGRRVVSLEDTVATDGEGECASLMDRLEDKQDVGPAHQAVRTEVRAAVNRAMAKLPERGREVVRLRYEQEWTFQQIAAHLGVSESRASQLHTQALSRMRQSLTAAGFHDGQLSA